MHSISSRVALGQIIVQESSELKKWEELISSALPLVAHVTKNMKQPEKSCKIREH